MRAFRNGEKIQFKFGVNKYLFLRLTFGTYSDSDWGEYEFIKSNGAFCRNGVLGLGISTQTFSVAHLLEYKSADMCQLFKHVSLTAVKRPRRRLMKKVGVLV